MLVTGYGMTSGYLRLFRLATECLPPSRGRTFSEAANRSLEAAGGRGRPRRDDDACSRLVFRFPGCSHNTVVYSPEYGAIMALGSGPRSGVRAPHRSSQGKCVILYIQTRSGAALPSPLAVDVAICLITHSSIQ